MKRQKMNTTRMNTIGCFFSILLVGGFFLAGMIYKYGVDRSGDRLFTEMAKLQAGDVANVYFPATTNPERYRGQISISQKQLDCLSKSYFELDINGDYRKVLLAFPATNAYIEVFVDKRGIRYAQAKSEKPGYKALQHAGQLFRANCNIEDWDTVTKLRFFK